MHKLTTRRTGLLATARPDPVAAPAAATAARAAAAPPPPYHPRCAAPAQQPSRLGYPARITPRDCHADGCVRLSGAHKHRLNACCARSLQISQLFVIQPES
eukprot:3813269-Pleurochrysis_carterae.AAC.3